MFMFIKMYYCTFLVIIIYVISTFCQVLRPFTGFNFWQKDCGPTIQYYFYNWTNPEDISNSSVKPDFDEVGPYTFSYCSEKTCIVWHDNNTLSFKEIMTWWFVPEESNGTLDDIITSVNIVAAHIGDFVLHQEDYMRDMIEDLINTAFEPLNLKMYVSVPLRQLLFDGYEDPILSALRNNTVFGLKLPKKYAHFYGINGTNGSTPFFIMNTGVNNQLGQLRSWYSQTDIPLYSDECNNLDGASTGDFFPPNLTKYDTIKIFDADMCRTFEYEFEKEVKINGSVGNVYIVGDKILDVGASSARNKCFSNDDCVPYGVINVGRCKFGPTYVSLPHFHKAHPYYLRAFNGVKKNPDHDNVYLIINKTTGTPLAAKLGMQVNLRLMPIKNISLFANLPDIFFPLYYEQRLLRNYLLEP